MAIAHVMDRAERVQREWLKGRFMEGHARNDLLNYIGNNLDRYTGGTFIDAGAHIGNHTIFFSTVCKAEKVISFEPWGPSLYAFNRNVELNELQNTVWLEAVALGSKKGQCAISSAEQSTMNSTTKGDTHPVIRFDTWAKKMKFPGGITFVKIDVEGDELAVLRGMRQSLKKYKPDVSVECPNAVQFVSVSQFFRGIGYAAIETKERLPIQFNPTPTYIFRHAETT